MSPPPADMGYNMSMNGSQYNSQGQVGRPSVLASVRLSVRSSVRPFVRPFDDGRFRSGSVERVPPV